MVYDGDGNRVSETAGGVTTKYFVDTLNPTGLSQVVDETVSGAVTRTYAYGLQRIDENQKISSTWTPSFYGYDGHGNVRFLTSTPATVTDSYDYDAFGMSVKSSGTTANNYLYSGERYDSSCGLYDLRARYYDPATGRFWAKDPVEGEVDFPLTLNSYLYALGDPVDRVDPTGRATTTWPSVAPAPGIEYAGLITVIAFGVLQGVHTLGQTIACGFSLSGSSVSSIMQNALSATNPFALQRVGPCTNAPTPNPCEPYERDIQEAMEEVLARYQELLMDANQLYCVAYDVANLGNRKGTWLGHLEAFYGVFHFECSCLSTSENTFIAQKRLQMFGGRMVYETRRLHSRPGQ
jgi:RHS repeat-associated protein